MEILRALGFLTEPPGEAHRRPARALGLGPLPEASEHTALFVFRLYPYASVYLGAEGKLGGEARDRVAGYWRALGMTPPVECDHLATLLSLYAEIAERDVGGEGEPGRWRQARRALFWEHLASWLGVYLKAVKGVATPFYREWAALLERCLEEEAERLGPLDRLPLHLRDSPPLPDPRLEGGSRLLEGLLAPVASGMVLVRDDLERAARDLGLGLRQGERRYALESLLAQDPEPALGWLAAEARRWERRHRRGADWLGEVGLFWAKRAAATGALLEEVTEDDKRLATTS